MSRGGIFMGNKRKTPQDVVEHGDSGDNLPNHPRAKPVSLKPLKFEEAVKGLLETGRLEKKSDKSG